MNVQNDFEINTEKVFDPRNFIWFQKCSIYIAQLGIRFPSIMINGSTKYMLYQMVVSSVSIIWIVQTLLKYTKLFVDNNFSTCIITCTMKVSICG